MHCSLHASCTVAKAAQAPRAGREEEGELEIRYCLKAVHEPHESREKGFDATTPHLQQQA